MICSRGLTRFLTSSCKVKGYQKADQELANWRSVPRKYPFARIGLPRFTNERGYQSPKSFEGGRKGANQIALTRMNASTDIGRTVVL